MLIRLLDRKYPCTFDDVGVDNPNVAIPTTISEEELNRLGYSRVEDISPPVVDPKIHRVFETSPEFKGGSSYRQKWVIESTPVEEIEKAATEKLAQDRIIATNAAQTLLDSTAKERGYDSALSCISYVGDNNPKFNSEGVAFKAWRSAVWAHCYEVDALDGPRPTLDEFLEGIPKMVWPS